MTLRVNLEIVPYGDESQKYSIGKLDIHNIKSYGLGFCDYRAQLYSEEGTLIKQTVDGTLTHSRQDGAWVLIKKALESLNIE